MSDIIDLTGRVFGRWTVLRFVSRENRRTLFCCRCECGVEKNVGSLSLLRTRKPSRSCGCGRPRPRGPLKHGASAGGQKTREYRIWKGMRDRCNSPSNPRFADYGGAGVKVCDRWSDFAAFLADMGPAPTALHTLDRKDNAKGYEPSNCRWATPTEQNRNRTNNKLTEAKAAEIRRRCDAGEPMRAIAADFHVSKKMVNEIDKGRAWKTGADLATGGA